MSIDPSPFAQRLEIQEAVLHQWSCRADSPDVKTALESARDPMLVTHPDAIRREWRWLADDLRRVYDASPTQGALCYEHCIGLLSGMERFAAQENNQ